MRLFRVQPRLDILLRAHLDVRTHLLVHVRVELLLSKQSVETMLQLSPDVHKTGVMRFS
jgi:hypothetical protein